MKFPIGSLLFDSNCNEFWIVMGSHYDDEDEEGVYVKYASPPVRKWTPGAIRLHQGIRRTMIEWHGVVADTMLTPEEFSYCERIA
jgi:hypothetical protein